MNRLSRPTGKVYGETEQCWWRSCFYEMRDNILITRRKAISPHASYRILGVGSLRAITSTWGASKYTTTT